ncbi:MAG: thioesterase family protein [Acidimicrobiales bacterium]
MDDTTPTAATPPTAPAPGTPLDHLLSLVTLEPLGERRWRGRAGADDGWDSVYGGHFLGQATAAACASVESGRRLHSAHGYFLKAGVAADPIDYEVEVVRDGRSFCTRRVRATQGKGVNFELLASFTVEETGPTLPAEAPADFAALPDPDSLPTYTELMRSRDPVPFPEGWAFGERGLDIRVINAPWCDAGPSPRGGIRTWNRTTGSLPDDPGLHAAVFAYLSDDSISDNVLVPFGVTWSTPGTMVFSLDHAMWLHRPFRMDEWHLVEQWPVVAESARGLAQGQVFDRRGVLVASITQEALVRI